MEGITRLEVAYRIMGDSMIGLREIARTAKLNSIFTIDLDSEIPPIKYSSELLEQLKETHILVLVVDKTFTGVPITFRYLRNVFGHDPEISEPCFYNQDWYLNEKFYKESRLQYRWVLVSKDINEESRGVSSVGFEKLPNALLCTYLFFTIFYIKNQILWPNDYVWCSDIDSNTDQIYVGRYFDPLGLNKNGFSIHRHLKIKSNYGCISLY